MINAPHFNFFNATHFFVLQEFGDSARARKLYEQDSESDDEELEPNPKLEQGKFSRRLSNHRAALWYLFVSDGPQNKPGKVAFRQRSYGSVLNGYSIYCANYLP